MTTVNTDAKYNGLGRFNYTGAQEDRELQFYRANGATSNSLPDAEIEFLSRQGFTTGTVEDRWVKYLESLGYKGTKEDMIRPWWGEMPGSELYMDFTKASPFTSVSGLDPRITFSRTTNATLTNSAGVLTYAPHNLLTFSEQFDNAAWVKSGATVTANNTIAPDGTTTGDFLVESATTGQHQVSQNLGTTTVGAVLTLTVYAKAGTRTRLALTSFGEGIPVFDLATGTVVSSSGAVTSISSVGNGWYRCSATITKTNTTNAWYYLLVDSGTNISYTGNGTSGLYIWGAQLNVGSLQPYYSTTVKNLLGYTQEFDNAAWTKSNSFVQTNQIRNNTMQGAVAGTPGTLPTDWFFNTALSGLTFSVVGSGIETGINYLDVRIQGTPSGAGNYDLGFVTNTQVSALTGQTWTESLFYKIAAGSANGVSSTTIRFNEYTSGGVFVTGQTSSALALPTSAGLSAQRVSATATLNGGATTAFIQPFLRIALSGAAVDFTLRIGLPQLVQGASAGDVVPTYGTARAVMYPAPDGSVTADKLVEDTANAQHHVRTPYTTTNSVITLSVYAKAAERNFLFIQLSNNATGAAGALFNLSAGTAQAATNGGDFTASSSSIVPLGNGWYRCSLTTTKGATNNAAWPYITVSNGTTSYTGDGTSGILIWGAQLSDSASLDPYVYNPGAAPAAAAYYGPRFDYDPVTLAPRGLLIEEQRTNSIRNNTMVGAVVGTPGTAPTNWSITSSGNGLTRTISTGVENGIDYIDIRYQGTTTASSFCIIRPEGLNQVAAASGQSWTSSLYMRVSAGSTANINAFENWVIGATSGGSIAESTQSTPAITSTMNRFTVSRTMNNATTAFVYPYVAFTFSSGVAIDITLRIGMPQLEQGAFATSVIPTTTASATRVADVATMTGANFSNWYNQSEGTLFVEGDAGGGTLPCFASIDDTTGNNRIQLRRATNDTLAALRMVSSGGSIDVTLLSGSAVGFNKQAASFSAGNQSAAANGTLFTGITSITSMPTVTRLDIGAGVGSTLLNGHIRRIAYYPRRLSNSELQGITA